MFGLVKPRLGPIGPIDFDFDIEIGSPPDDVFALVDWADPRNAKRQLGHAVTPIPGAADRFLLVLNSLPTHRFELTVTEAVPRSVYAFACEIVPRIGRLATATERYSIEPCGVGGCRVTLVTAATFVKGMRQREVERETATMWAACHNALMKLKLHAEEGVDAVRAVEHRAII